MDEPDVVVALSEYLDEGGFRFFIDSGYSSQEIHKLPERLNGCGLNNTIRIGRRIPDIIGYNQDSEIIAIEVKGEDNIRKGIGQAAHYRQGVHKSFLAADTNALKEFEDTVASCGIGAFFVRSDEAKTSSIETKEPIQNVAATELNKTQRALAIKTSDFQSDRSAFSSSTMPLNAFLPVVMISRRDPTGSFDKNLIKSDIAEHEHGVGSSTSEHAFALARTLQFVEVSSRSPVELRLTDAGRIGNYLLKGKVEEFTDWKYGIDQSQVPDDFYERILAYLTELKKNSQYKSRRIYESDSEVAAFLRDRYLAIPDVRQLTEVLAGYNGNRAELSRILAEIAVEAPEVFMNLFVQSSLESDFRVLIDDSSRDPENREFQKKILDLASPDYLYNFVRQLIHVQILTSESDPVHQEDDRFDGEYYWLWDRDTVGEIGSRTGW